MTYTQSHIIQNGCACGSHVQHLILRFKWETGGSLKAASDELHLPYTGVRQAWTRFNRRADKDRRCPVCFEPKRYGLQCHGCGAELGQVDRSAHFDFESQSPVYLIQPRSGLGSVTSYNSLRGLNNTGRILKNQAEKFNGDASLEKAKSELMQWIKGLSPKEEVTDAAAKLLIKEFQGFRARYPGLKIKPAIAGELTENVKRRLKLAYPHLANCDSVTLRSGAVE